MEITSSVTELFWPHFPVQLYASLPFLFICSIIHLCHPETNPAGDQKGSKKWNRLELTLITSSKSCLCIVVVSFTMPVLDRQEESWTNLCEDHTFLTFAVFFFFFPTEEHVSTKCYSYISYTGSQAVLQFPRVLAQAGISSFLLNPIQPYLLSGEFRWLTAACLNPE